MAILRALINKETLRVICETKRVEVSYIAEKISCKPTSKVDEWLNLTSDTLPTNINDFWELFPWNIFGIIYESRRCSKETTP